MVLSFNGNTYTPHNVHSVDEATLTTGAQPLYMLAFPRNKKQRSDKTVCTLQINSLDQSQNTPLFAHSHIKVFSQPCESQHSFRAGCTPPIQSHHHQFYSYDPYEKWQLTTATVQSGIQNSKVILIQIITILKNAKRVMFTLAANVDPLLLAFFLCYQGIFNPPK